MIYLFKHLNFYQRVFSIIFVLSFCFFRPSFADEGMWLPFLLKQLNEEAMIKAGLKIPVEKIYSLNQSSLKDAVVLFGGGCTGAVISDKGLLLTNHHCGFSSIQALSSVEHDYLTAGYWAMKQEVELPCPNLTVTFIIRMEDVSDAVNKELSDSMSEPERNAKIRELSNRIEKKAIEGTHYEAKVQSFFNGNQFFLIVTEKFLDIRLVGAPPSSIGKFGGETDNWMWPRHEGDFSLFRIYAGADNKPAPYSPSNIAFTPGNHFTISLKGVKEGDFTMVYGFPGRTQEYLPSYAINIIQNETNPSRIKIRDARLEIMEEGMRISDTVRIKYASKQRSLSNAYKKWQGELVGLKKSNTVAKKQEFEKNFSEWVSKNKKDHYKNLLIDFETQYKAYSKYNLANDFFNEAISGIEITNLAISFRNLVQISYNKDTSNAEIKAETEKLKGICTGFFKNYDARIDKKIFAALLKMYVDDVDTSFFPAFLKTISKKYQHDFNKYAEDVFTKSIFASQSKTNNLLAAYSPKSVKTIEKDPAYLLINSFAVIKKQKDVFQKINENLNKLNRLYMAAQMEMQKDKTFYPDANLTLRLAYGQVADYVPRNAVKYQYQTTLEGVMEKEDSLSDEFIVPKKLKELYTNDDFGNYGEGKTMPLAFIASNHTTGGNSGSPVINATGELIGLNFDRVWEGTMSDLQYDPKVCRNIALNMRYTLFIIDKFAGCQRLINEMTIHN